MRRGALALVATSIGLVVAGTVALASYLLARPATLPLFITVPAFYVIPIVLSFAVVSWAILRRRPGHPVGWLLGIVGLGGAVSHAANAMAVWSLDWHPALLVVWTLSNAPIWVALALALLLFPTGVPPSKGWRWVVWASLVYLVLATAIRVFAPWENAHAFTDLAVQTFRGWPANPLGVTNAGWLSAANVATDLAGIVLVLLGAASLGPRWRRSTGDERQQLKWLGLAALAFALELTLGASQAFTGGMPVNDAKSEFIGQAIFALVVAGIPVAIGFGIVRYRLYQIDVLVSRTLVAAGLVTFLGAGYVLAVLGAGALLQRWTAPALALSVTTGVAVAFQPLRTRLRRGANRLVFGERAEPYELMARFGAELGGAMDEHAVLARIAEAVGRAVRPIAVRVSVAVGDDPLSAVWPSNRDGATDVVVPVLHEGAPVGEIAVAGPGLGPADIGILNQLAIVSAPSLRSIGLLADLRSVQAAIAEQNQELAASRARLVAAADAERMRLAEVITSRLEPLLRQIGELLPATVRDLTVRPEDADRDLAQLAGLANQVVSDLREVSRGVLPRLIVDHGLGAALRALVRRIDRPITLELSPDVASARFPAPVETTVYLCCRDALDYVGTATTLRLWSEDGRLCFRIWGGDWAQLTTMSDRVAALDGALQSDANAISASVPVNGGEGRRPEPAAHAAQEA